MRLKELTRVIWVASGEMNKFKYVLTKSISLPVPFVEYSSSSVNLVHGLSQTFLTCGHVCYDHSGFQKVCYKWKDI